MFGEIILLRKNKLFKESKKWNKVYYNKAYYNIK